SIELRALAREASASGRAALDQITHHAALEYPQMRCRLRSSSEPIQAGLRHASQGSERIPLRGSRQNHGAGVIPSSADSDNVATLYQCPGETVCGCRRQVQTTRDGANGALTPV